MPKTKNKGARKAMLKRRKRRMIFASADNGMIQVEGTGSIQIAAVGEDGGPPKFAMNAYTGAAMRPNGWRRSEPLILDLAGIAFPKNGRIPIHRDHDTSKVVGHSESISVDGGLQIRGLVSGANSHANEVVGTSKNGFPWQSSVGAELTSEPEFVDAGKNIRVNGRIVAGPVYVARNTKLKEVSFVSLGADDSTSAVAANDNRKGSEMEKALAEFVKASGFDPETLSAEQIKYFEAQHKAKLEADKEKGSESKTKADEIAAKSVVDESRQGDDVGDAAKAIEAQAAEAFKRVASIQAKMGDHPELAAKAIEERWSDDKMDLELLRASRSRGPGVAIHSHVAEYGGEHVECAMAAGAGVSEDAFDSKVVEHTKKLQASGHLPRHCGLQFLFHDILRAGGRSIHPSAVVDNGLITDAKRIDASLNSGQTHSISASSGFSTLSLPGILSNLMNKRMLDAYSMQPSTFRRFARISSASDFKPSNKYRMYGLGDLEELGPTGEIKHTEFGEDAYQISVKTRARMIALTRVMIRNDDMDALMRIPTNFGEAGGRTLEKSVYQTLLAGITSGFFSVSASYDVNGYNPNRITGALSLAKIEEAETLFLEQQDRNGDPISIKPTMLLTGHKLKHHAEILLNKRSVVVAGDPTTGDQLRIADEYTGQFAPFSSPYVGVKGGISGGTDTGWFLMGAPGSGALIDVAFLDGRQAPIIESDDTDFNTLGMQWRAYFDWGTALEDAHYAVFSNGL